MTWQFKNVMTINRYGEATKYNVSLSAGDLADLFEEGLIIYEGKIQRGTKQNAKGQEVDIFSLKKIKEIQAAMISGTLFGSTITLNYPKEAETPMEYNEEDKSLTGQTPLQIVDGQHRIRACARWKKEYEKNNALPNPYDFEFPVAIENLSELEAMQCFAEYALKPTKVSRTRATYLDVGSLTNNIVRHLLKESELRGKVECTSSAIKGKNNNIVTFGTLVSAINENFKPATHEQASEIKEFLVKYFEHLVNMFPEAMGSVDAEKRAEARQKSIKIETLTWYGYISAANALRDQRDWKKKLGRLKEKITIGEWKGTILDRNCPIWQGTIFCYRQLKRSES